MLDYILLIVIAAIGLFFLTRSPSNVKKLIEMYDFTVNEEDVKKVKIKAIY